MQNCSFTPQFVEMAKERYDRYIASQAKLKTFLNLPKEKVKQIVSTLTLEQQAILLEAIQAKPLTLEDFVADELNRLHRTDR